MSEYFRFLENDEEPSSADWVVIEDDSSDDIIVECKNFDCPTDEIIVKSSSCGVSRRRSGGGAVQTPSPSPPAQVPAAAQSQEEVIVIPANADSLQQALQQVTANGVTVLDVRSLGSSSERSSPSSDPQVTVVQAPEGHHYIAVTGSTSRSYASLSNALVEGDGGGVGYHVQYVEPQELYTTQSQQGQGQVSYSLYSSVNEGNNNYSPGSSSNTGQWYGNQPTSHHYLISGTASTQETTSTVHRTSPQTVSAEEVSYLNNTHSGAQEENAAAQVGHSARTSPATVSQFTVQWLLENYETAEGVSLPRSTLYSHYLRHCNQRELEPVNAASFGKLIRSVFMGLRTRRLGTRGNSKYHYYGIRVKPGSSLSASSFESGTSGNSKASSAGRCSNGTRSNVSTVGGGTGQSRHDEQSSNSHMHQHQQFLGDGCGAIPHFPEIHFTQPLPGDCTHEDVDTLRSIYREHCEAFLDAVLSLELSTVESLWREFWRQNNNNDSDECEEEKYLSKTKLYQLCSMNEVQAWVRSVDVNFYQRLVQVLLPDVLRPIPSPLTQAIRNFAKGLESWLIGAMSGCPPGMIRAKANPAAALAQSLRRYTSLNHLAQAARAVLHNHHQIQQMLADLNRVDFHNVQEQASWVCECPGEVVSELEADFKRTLQKQASLEQWASWLESTVKKALRPHEGFPDYARHARQFLLKWSFYSSMVIRDLTLRSAASFGSFHLIRLLYDEYMFYLIEHLVAEHQGSAPIQVMAERESCNGTTNMMDENDSDGGTFIVSSVCIKAEDDPSKKMKIS